MSLSILKIFLILSFSGNISSKPRLFEDLTSFEGSGMGLAINENQLNQQNQMNPEGFQYDDYVLENDKHFEPEPEPEHFELEPKETRDEEPINENSIFSMIFNGGKPSQEEIDYEEVDCVPQALSFFIPHNAVNTNIFGSQASTLNICSECAHGNQPTFASIRSNFSTIEPFNIDDPVIGSFYCPNGEICIEEENGTLWTSTFDAPTITLVPVPSCQNDICAVYMLFVVGPRAPGRENTADLISLTDNRSFRAEDMQMSGGFRNIDEFGYVKIRGFGCHRCTLPIQYCMKN